MGMYTDFTVEGTIKPEYREKFAELYALKDSDGTLKEDVHKIGFKELYDFVEGYRSNQFIYGMHDDPVEFDKETGHFYVDADIKDYEERVDESDLNSSYKKKRTSELFMELIPVIFEEDGFEFTKMYEEDPIRSYFILKNGELIMTNAKEWEKAFEEEFGGGGYR